MAESKTVDLWALSDLCTPWCVHVAVTLRVAEAMERGLSEVGEVALAIQCDAYALRGILRHLVGKGLFLEPRPGWFELNDAARQLLDPGMRLGLDLDGFGGRMAHVWNTLLKYARTGRPAYADVFGMSFWEDLEVHPEISAQFDDLIGPPGHGIPNAEFEITGGWDGIRTVVDVGGGTGAFLRELLRLRPHLRGTLVDLPRTVARAKVAERMTVAGQSFFDPLPPGADLYMLRGVLNDFPDTEAVAILRRMAEAGPRIVVLKSVDEQSGGHGIGIEQILAGGRHRSVDELRKLAPGCGLEVVAAERTPAGFMVELRAN